MTNRIKRMENKANIPEKEDHSLEFENNRLITYCFVDITFESTESIALVMLVEVVNLPRDQEPVFHIKFIQYGTSDSHKHNITFCVRTHTQERHWVPNQGCDKCCLNEQMLP